MNQSSPRRNQRQPLSDELFIRPGRLTPRKKRWQLEQLKSWEPLNFMEDGVPIRRSEEDFMDEAYAQGVQAGLDASAVAWREQKASDRDRNEFADGGEPLTRNSDEHPEQSYRRGYQQGAHAVLQGLSKAGKLDERTMLRLHAFVYHDIGDWRYARRRKLERHVVKDRAPMLDLQTGISRSVASRKARRGTIEKCPTVLF